MSLRELELQNNSMSSVVLEYGNISSCVGSSSNTCFATFCKEVHRKNSAKKLPKLSKVDFNINPHYSKPTATVKEMSEVGFGFEYTFSRSYPCVMTVHFEDNVLPKLKINYRVQAAPQTRHRIIIQVSKTFSVARKSDVIIFEGEPPQDGWIRFSDRERGEIEYIRARNDNKNRGIL